MHKEKHWKRASKLAMKFEHMASGVIGAVVGYNSYIHVWNSDLLWSLLTGLGISVSIYLWLTRLVHHAATSGK